MVRSIFAAPFALAALLSMAAACNKSNGDAAGEAQTTGAKPTVEPAVTPPSTPSLNEKEEKQLDRGIRDSLAADKSGPPIGDGKLGAKDEKTTDDSYGGSANGGSSSPPAGGAHMAPGTVKAKAAELDASTKPGHVLSPTKTTDLPH